MAFVPIMLHQISKEKASEAHVYQQTPSTSATVPPANSAPTQAEPKAHKTVGFGEFVLSCFVLLGFGLISPVLEITGSPAHGLLNAFIIFIGVRYAWQMMAVRTVEVDGPFETTEQKNPA